MYGITAIRDVASGMMVVQPMTISRLSWIPMDMLSQEEDTHDAASRALSISADSESVKAAYSVVAGSLLQSR